MQIRNDNQALKEWKSFFQGGGCDAQPLLPGAGELLPYDEVATSGDPAVVAAPCGPRGQAEDSGSLGPGQRGHVATPRHGEHWKGGGGGEGGAIEGDRCE